MTLNTPSGKPYSRVQHLYGARWHGFAPFEIVERIFEWTEIDGRATSKELSRTVEESGWRWRGFAREARRFRSHTLESGLLPGAIAREINRDC